MLLGTLVASLLGYMLISLQMEKVSLELVVELSSFIIIPLHPSTNFEIENERKFDGVYSRDKLLI